MKNVSAIERWRIGTNIPLNVYEGDRPVCQCHNLQDAVAIRDAMNARTELAGLQFDLEHEREQRKANFDAWQAACGTIANQLKELAGYTEIGPCKRGHAKAFWLVPECEHASMNLTCGPECLPFCMLCREIEQAVEPLNKHIADLQGDIEALWHSAVCPLDKCERCDEDRERVEQIEKELRARGAK